MYIGLPKCEYYRTARFELVSVYKYVAKLVMTPSMWDRLFTFIRYPDGLAVRGTKVIKEAVSKKVSCGKVYRFYFKPTFFYLHKK